MNDGSRLVVNFARLYETSAHIEAAVSTLESQLAVLEREAAPLVQAWSGEAMQAYQQRQATWRQSCDDLTAMLRQIKRALDESIADYGSTERHNADLFR
jgi:6 kDa early secretory antigenic target